MQAQCTLHTACQLQFRTTGHRTKLFRFYKQNVRWMPETQENVVKMTQSIEPYLFTMVSLTLSESVVCVCTQNKQQSNHLLFDCYLIGRKDTFFTTRNGRRRLHFTEIGFFSSSVLSAATKPNETDCLRCGWSVAHGSQRNPVRHAMPRAPSLIIVDNCLRYHEDRDDANDQTKTINAFAWRLRVARWCD